MASEIALIVGLSLLLTLGIVSGVLIYSYYIYSKNRLFNKNKYSFMWIVCLVLAIFMLVAVIIFAINLKAQTFVFGPVFVGLSFTCFSLCIIYLVALLLIPYLTNKHKIKYEDILLVNYDDKIKQLMQKIGDVEALKTNLANKHRKYYQAMLSYYESILNRAKNDQISKVDKIADIVTFNDAFTHKWSTFNNYYQILLTYKFCQILQKIS